MIPVFPTIVIIIVVTATVTSGIGTGTGARLIYRLAKMIMMMINDNDIDQ